MLCKQGFSGLFIEAIPEVQVEVIRGDDAHNPLLPKTHISYYCAMMCHHTSHMSNPVPKGGFRTCVSAYAGQ